MGAAFTQEPTATLARVFSAHGKSLHLVGGSVRDIFFLDRATSPDLDFTTDARPEETKRLLREAGADHIFAIGEKFGTVGARLRDSLVEITTYRSEHYTPGSRKPAVRFGDSLKGDLSRRDFTINAIAHNPLDETFEDPYGGRVDCAARLIRAVGIPRERFAEDPLRLLRAVRFVVQLGFEIETTTLQAIRDTAEHLTDISRERIAQELGKILLLQRAGLGIRLLCDYGLMPYIIPEILAMRGMRQDTYHHKDVFEHTLLVVDRSPPRPTVRWSALLHDIGKPRTRGVVNGEVHFFGHERVGEHMSRKILAGLHLDRPTIERVSTLVGMHQRANAYEPDWTDGAVRRFIREAADALDDLIDLSAADVTSRRPDRIRAAAERVAALRARIEDLRAREEVEKLASPLDGNELMELFNRGPGAWIKPIKERLLAAVLDGELQPDDRAAATELAQQTMAELEVAQAG